MNSHDIQSLKENLGCLRTALFTFLQRCLLFCIIKRTKHVASLQTFFLSIYYMEFLLSFLTLTLA